MVSQLTLNGDCQEIGWINLTLKILFYISSSKSILALRKSTGTCVQARCQESTYDSGEFVSARQDLYVLRFSDLTFV